MTQPTPNNEMMSTARVEAFSDGVFAIIVTLLILSIRMPQISRDQVAQQLPRQLLQLWPHILSYVLSFLVVGVGVLGGASQPLQGDCEKRSRAAMAE